ncbi:MAG TPA: phosphatidylserine decarboxylase [Microlunatus sp.]
MTVYLTTQPEPGDVPLLKPVLAHQGDADFVALLEASLSQAQGQARAGLAADLYAALTWPVTFADYAEFLVAFARWIPQQSTDPAWIDPGTPEHQEVYDRLCHFYWLIDQPVGPAGQAVQDIGWFSDWLIGYADVWGEFLDTTESFSDEILQTFLADSPKYRVQDSMIDGRPNNPSGWLTFNQFFARDLNPGLRPIAAPTTNTVAVAPADCTYKQQYRIGADSGIPAITIKGTHTYANVRDLLAGSRYADAFAGGYFIHFFLGPYSYHRFHAPVSGTVQECYPVHGKVYLKVQLAQDQFQAYDASEGAYEFAQARGILTIDTTSSPAGNVGIVGVIPVGMCQVSGVNMTHVPGAACLKGDQFGYFTFGGSDIIVLFQAGTDPAYNPQFSLPTPPYSLYGSEIATVTGLGG